MSVTGGAGWTRTVDGLGRMPNPLDGVAMYLDLLERVVTNLIYEDAPIPTPWITGVEFNGVHREQGTDCPSVAHTMVGLKRVHNVRTCLDRVVAEGVAGDFIETGVWRGGVCIFARGYLKAYGIADRRVWAADSFRGIPDTGAAGHSLDRRMALHRYNDVLGVPLAQVKANFEQYGLLDDRVEFLDGWFRDTLPGAAIDKLAVLRLDGDLYESTMDALVHLYPKLSLGGYVIVDDYNLPACRKAVHDYRDRHRVTERIEIIDHCGVHWRKCRP